MPSILKGDDYMSRAGLLCRGHFYPGITQSDPSRSRHVFTKRVFKAVRMNSILPDALLLLVLFSGWPGERYNMEKQDPGIATSGSRRHFILLGVTLVSRWINISSWVEKQYALILHERTLG